MNSRIFMAGCGVISVVSGVALLLSPLLNRATKVEKTYTQAEFNTQLDRQVNVLMLSAAVYGYYCASRGIAQKDMTAMLKASLEQVRKDREKKEANRE